MAWPSEPSQRAILRPSKFGHSTDGDSTYHLFAGTVNLGLSHFIEKMRKGSR